MMDVLAALFVLVLLMLLCTLGLSTVLMGVWLMERREDRATRRAPASHPAQRKCQHCRKVHAGPEDCEHWERLT
jgi:uncharacterized iron-regulated membrane protein